MSIKAEDTVYTSAFYARQRDGSASSAEAIVPLVLSQFPAKSVVDVGCGVGAWLKTFEQNGVDDYLGLDGDYVTADLLQIPSARFRACDLERLTDVGRRFDLACSLEVAEHLTPGCAEQFVAALVKAAPVVLFSAAIPLQEGTNHINLRWQKYWSDLFTRHGYIAVDCIRPAVHEDERVAWWYRQNVLIFCEPGRCPAGHAPAKSSYDLNRIDPVLLQHVASRPHDGTQALAYLGKSLSVLRGVLFRKIGLAGLQGKVR